jgi:hypothetical protein
MTAAGEDHQRLTFTPTGQASSQPSWFPDKSAILFRRSGSGGVSSIWQMGPFGEDPELRYDPPGGQLYESLSPDMRTVLFETVTSPSGDTDRAIQTLSVDGTGLTTLFNVVGAFDSAPAWSPDGTKIAFESDANLNGGNPERDMEVWLMEADGANPTRLTHNGLHDEGPAWSPDGALLAYSSGTDNLDLDINVMTSAGVHPACTCGSSPTMRGATNRPTGSPSPPRPPIAAAATQPSRATASATPARQARGCHVRRRSNSPQAGHRARSPATARPSSKASTPTSPTSAGPSVSCSPTTAPRRRHRQRQARDIPLSTLKQLAARRDQASGAGSAAALRARGTELEFAAYQAVGRTGPVAASLGPSRALRKRYESALSRAQALGADAIRDASIAAASSRSIAIRLTCLILAVFMSIAVGYWLVPLDRDARCSARVVLR